ncbi:MAG: tyrosine-type recombinase/integrase [Haloglomus sp.]
MSDYPEATIARLVERAEASADMSEADAAVIFDAHDEIELLGRQEFSVASHETILMHAVKFAVEVGGLHAAIREGDREATERIVRWINREYDNPETNKRKRTALRRLAALASDGEGMPDSVAWVPSTYPSTYDPAPEPGKMYHWDDHIEPMLDAARNSRDRAWVATAWDLGARMSELYALQHNDVSDSDHGLQITIRNGKTGTRTPTLITAVPYLRRWLDDHPGRGEDYLWTRLNRAERISQNRLRDILKELADEAAMTPPSTPTPTRMRKSSASFLASQGVPQPHLEQHHGWARGSDEAARYIAVFGDAAEREIAAAHGVDVEPDEPDEIAPMECYRCGRDTPRDRETCMWCGQALSPEAAADAEARERRAQETLARMDSEKAIAFLRVIESMDDPEVAAALDELRD